MKKNKLTSALTVLGLFCVNLLLAQTTIRGTITDAETDAPIPGSKHCHSRNYRRYKHRL